jgi:PAS domain S-box-containing protein
LIRPMIRVLLVENDEAICHSILRSLESCHHSDYDCRLAGSLVEAEALLAEEDFDLLLAEMMLPDSQGHDTVNALRSATRNRRPIIVLTDSEYSELAIQSLQFGVQDVLSKRDFTQDLLCRMIRISIERKQLEVRLQEQVEVTKNVISTIPHFVFWKDLDSIYQGCNAQFSQACGLDSPEDIVGKSDYELAWTTEESDGYRQCDRQVMDNDAPMLNIEETQEQADGNTLAVLTSKVPLRGESGEVVGILGIYLDISERRRLEHDLEERTRSLEKANTRLLASQDQLVQSEKLASIGQLAAGVAHEINNPVGFVMSNLRTLGENMNSIQRLLDSYQGLVDRLDQEVDFKHRSLMDEITKFKDEEDLDFILEDTHQLLEESLDGTNRIREIVQNLRTFARLDESQVKPADLNQGLESTLNIVSNQLKYKCTVNKKYGIIPDLRCHLGRLNQVFMNLLLNAGHAIEDKGEITIETWSDDEEIHVRISDTGHGISEKNLSKLFDPFFTTKPIGKGTGLGLSVSHGIVQKHGGRIAVASETGKGTSFTVSLPLAGIESEVEVGVIG